MSSFCKIFFAFAPWSHTCVQSADVLQFSTNMTTLSVGLRRAGFTGDEASLNVLVRILRELHLYVIEDLHGLERCILCQIALDLAHFISII